MDDTLLFTIIAEVICITTIVLLLKDVKITKVVKRNENETESDEYN
jgi:hypothetical protein